MKVLLTGAQGQVGRAVAALRPAHVDLQPLTHQALDISDAAAVRATVGLMAPDWIINAAAFTAVDRAEAEPSLAEAVNAVGPANLAQAARSAAGCRLLQISTDYVFDGTSRVPYRPQDPTNPVSVYGRTKLGGEQAVQATLADRAVILRTAWVYAARGHNFLLTMLRLMREHGEVRVVADQQGCPTAAESVARAIWAVLARSPPAGILHWSDAGTCSWYDFAELIARSGVAEGILQTTPRLTPISTVDYPTPARRPPYSVLELTETAAALNLKPRPWSEALQTVLREIRASAEPPARGLRTR